MTAIPRVMRLGMLTRRTSYAERFMTLLNGKLVAASFFGEQGTNRDLIAIDDDGGQTPLVKEYGLDEWLRQRALGDERGWYRDAWIRVAQPGSLLFDQVEIFLKFENGDTAASWRGICEVLPAIDPLTLLEVEPDELTRLRKIEEDAAMARMANVDAIDRELKRRADLESTR